ARPNIVVIYIDDMGYGQPGCYGGKLAPTPNFDSLAANGVRFTDGYVSAPVCSPSRVGLMTGRYQARTGHDANTGRPGSELLLSEVTMGQYLQRAGYATAIVGKWHLGATPQHLPAARGFDFSVGSVSNLGEGSGPSFYRGKELLETLPGAPVTSPYYASEACRFIDENRAKPFFLYLPLNAVHAPHVASPEWIEKFSRIEDRRDRAYAAQIGEMDAAIGTVLDRLRAHRLEENTLVFCLSDNGGAGVQSDKKGLRGGKWNLNEGGVRVSYVAQWKGRIPAGRVESTPVIQLDILPTALAAAGASFQPTNELDGVNLLPLLEGKGRPNREALYWRFGVQYAVRAGDWKLVKSSEKETPRLHNVRQDPQEAKDLAAAEPARAKELQAQWDRWNANMKPPRWEDRRWLGDEVRQERKKNAKKKRD
nr:sulfatase-like hydrolase/transferase [Bryobacter sp.]